MSAGSINAPKVALPPYHASEPAAELGGSGISEHHIRSFPSSKKPAFAPDNSLDSLAFYEPSIRADHGSGTLTIYDGQQHVSPIIPGISQSTYQSISFPLPPVNGSSGRHSPRPEPHSEPSEDREDCTSDPNRQPPRNFSGRTQPQTETSSIVIPTPAMFLQLLQKPAPIAYGITDDSDTFVIRETSHFNDSDSFRSAQTVPQSRLLADPCYKGKSRMRLPDDCHITPAIATSSHHESSGLPDSFLPDFPTSRGIVPNPDPSFGSSNLGIDPALIFLRPPQNVPSAPWHNVPQAPNATLQETPGDSSSQPVSAEPQLDRSDDTTPHPGSPSSVDHQSSSDDDSYQFRLLPTDPELKAACTPIANRPRVLINNASQTTLDTGEVTYYDPHHHTAVPIPPGTSLALYLNSNVKNDSKRFTCLYIDPSSERKGSCLMTCKEFSNWERHFTTQHVRQEFVAMACGALEISKAVALKHPRAAVRIIGCSSCDWTSNVGERLDMGWNRHLDYHERIDRARIAKEGPARKRRRTEQN